MALPTLEVSRYELNVPSTGEKIDYRPYLVKEEKQLMMALETKDQNQMLKVLGEIVEVCTFNKLSSQNMTIFDLEYIFVKLRGKSVGDTSEIGMKCSHCEHENKIKIDFNAIEVPVDLNDNMLLDISDTIKVKLRYPKMKNMLDIMAGGHNEVDAIFYTIAGHIETIFMGDDTYHADEYKSQELLEFLESFNSEQFSKIREKVNNAPTVRMPLNFTCEECGKENDLVVTGTENFFA